MKAHILRGLNLSVFCVALALLMTRSVLPPGDRLENVRAFTRMEEFDYLSWTFSAFGLKLQQSAENITHYFPPETRKNLVQDYVTLINEIHELNFQISLIYANPDITNPDEVSLPYQSSLNQKNDRLTHIAPYVESILQEQISSVVKEMGLSTLGQPIPPLLFHVTPLPYALIISPRSIIQQDANISINSGMSIQDMINLENEVNHALDVSSLVVPVGGVGVYPTMIGQSSSIEWLTEVVAHEWIHNFLTLRPLGFNYDTSPELRTMNETVASIAGKEIGYEVLRQYYPENLPPPAVPTNSMANNTNNDQNKSKQQPAVFNYRAEMHKTRLTVDSLLADGKIIQAEDYMEERRHFFWQHGYHIRKLNQAYFAFYGAYADEPGGAAGTDPVGTAVRQFRQANSSLASFVKRIAWITSLEELQKAVNHEPE